MKETVKKSISKRMDITNPRRFITCLIIVFLGISIPIFWFGWGGSKLLRSGDVLIEDGTTAKELWQTLQTEGYTRRTTPWRYFEWRLNAATRIQAGTFHLNMGESVKTAITRFISGNNVAAELTITFPEGFSLQQIAERTEAQGIGVASDFMREARPKEFSADFSYLSGLQDDRTLEGYLFPDTYHVLPDDKPQEVIRRMLENFNNKFSDDLRTEAKVNGRSIDQAVIMASIIEREVTSDNDMALISGILWKRFDEGLGLDADATVRYAINKSRGILTVDDLAVDSAYNTRKYRGLPPGPISNPGLRALMAAVRPEASAYYYYLSAPSGETIFSKTNEEHNQNKIRFLR